MPWCSAGHRMADGDRFCGTCGAMAALAGRHCANGHPGTEQDRFCGTCGAPMTGGAPTSAALATHRDDASSGTASVQPLAPTSQPRNPAESEPPVVIPSPVAWSDVPPPPREGAPSGRLTFQPPGVATPAPTDLPAVTAVPAAGNPLPPATHRPLEVPPRPGRSSRRGRRWPAAVITVCVVLVGAAAVAYFGGLRPGGGHPKDAAAQKTTVSSTTTATAPPTTGSTASPTTAAPPPPSAQQVASDISSMLAASAQDRHTVVVAAAELQSCSNVAAALSAFHSLESHRRSLLLQLSTLDASTLSNGTLIKADLLAAWQASLAADKAYATWASDDLGFCSPNLDPNAANVDAADQAATEAKTAFTAVWNPVATSYGLPTVTQASI